MKLRFKASGARFLVVGVQVESGWKVGEGCSIRVDRELSGKKTNSRLTISDYQCRKTDTENEINSCKRITGGNNAYSRHSVIGFLGSWLMVNGERLEAGGLRQEDVFFKDKR